MEEATHRGGVRVLFVITVISPVLFNFAYKLLHLFASTSKLLFVLFVFIRLVYIAFSSLIGTSVFLLETLLLKDGDD